MKKIIELLDKSQKVAILTHINADGDAIGSSQAMAEVLKNRGKTVKIYTEEPVEKRLNFISDGITVFDNDFEKADTCIVLDCGSIDRTGKRIVILEQAQAVINIDHHRTNTMFGDENLVMPDAAATGEILALLFNEMGIEYNEVIAKYLYVAICSDTGRFSYSNVSKQTFLVAAKLVEYNINHPEISRLLFESKDLNTELMRAELTGNIHSYFGGKLRTVSADRSLAEKYAIAEEDIQDIVDIPRRIAGTEIAAGLKEKDGKIRVSLRSNGNADVSEIAISFGGGGHAKAAGCTLEGCSLEEAEQKVVKACEERLV